MVSQTLLTTIAAGMASANAVLPRDSTITTTSTAPTTTASAHRSECMSKFSALYNEAPKAPSVLGDFLGCNAVPSSLTAAASAYRQTAASWMAAHTAEIQSLLQECTELPSAAASTGRYSCTYTGTDLATTTAATATGAAPTGTGAKTGGVNRETGLAWAAAAIAGVLGAVAML